MLAKIKDAKKEQGVNLLRVVKFIVEIPRGLKSNWVQISVKNGKRDAKKKCLKKLVKTKRPVNFFFKMS